MPLGSPEAPFLLNPSISGTLQVQPLKMCVKVTSTGITPLSVGSSPVPNVLSKIKYACIILEMFSNWERVCMNLYLNIETWKKNLLFILPLPRCKKNFFAILFGKIGSSKLIINIAYPHGFWMYLLRCGAWGITMHMWKPKSNLHLPSLHGCRRLNSSTQAWQQAPWRGEPFFPAIILGFYENTFV